MKIDLTKAVVPEAISDAEQNRMLQVWAFDPVEHERTFATKRNFDKARIERDILALLGPVGWL